MSQIRNSLKISPVRRQNTGQLVCNSDCHLPFCTGQQRMILQHILHFARSATCRVSNLRSTTSKGSKEGATQADCCRQPRARPHRLLIAQSLTTSSSPLFPHSGFNLNNELRSEKAKDLNLHLCDGKLQVPILQGCAAGRTNSVATTMLQSRLRPNARCCFHARGLQSRFDARDC